MSNNYVFWTGSIQSGFKAPEYWSAFTFSEHAQFIIFNVMEGKVDLMTQSAIIKKFVDICKDYTEY